MTYINVTMKSQSQSRRNSQNKNNRTAFFEDMCLPGMTQDFRLPVFFRFFDESKYDLSNDIKLKNLSSDASNRQLKLVFVCEEQNQEVEHQLTTVADAIFDELICENLLSFLKQSEHNMYKSYGKYSIILFSFTITFS